ncbi:hypothetical protein [Streptomyces sp. NPDC015131]|uniref:hypothetical protein n=1 Tax=Streptomyces sp. NPDC015131 TaxID=3364941 RepID=UPI0036F88DB1
MLAQVPHAAYGEAVHAALAAAEVAPDGTSITTELTATGSRNLLITCTWLKGDPALGAGEWHRGMRIVWRHAHGWFLEDPTTLLSRSVPVPLLAAPEAVADVAAEAGTHGMYDDLDRPVDLPGSDEQWDQARALDKALADWEDLP